MKLSELTTEDKIKLAAELDGFVLRGRWWTPTSEDIQRMPRDLETGAPLYATSYDAIIPLCFKYWGDWFWMAMRDKASPSQLLDALLVATGKAEV